MTHNDRKKAQELRMSGWTTKKIWKEHFPTLKFWEVCFALHHANTPASARKMVKYRLLDLREGKPEWHHEISDELQNLVCDLYEENVAMRRQMERIRSAVKA